MNVRSMFRKKENANGVLAFTSRASRCLTTFLQSSRMALTTPSPVPAILGIVAGRIERSRPVPEQGHDHVPPPHRPCA